MTGWLSLFRRQPSLAIARFCRACSVVFHVPAVAQSCGRDFSFFALDSPCWWLIRGATLMPVLTGCLIRPLRPYQPVCAAPAGVALAGLMILASAATVPRCYALPKQDFTGARDYAMRLHRLTSRSPRGSGRPCLRQILCAGVEDHPHGRRR